MLKEVKYVKETLKFKTINPIYITPKDLQQQNSLVVGDRPLIFNKTIADAFDSFFFFKMFKLMDLDGDKHFSKDDLGELEEADQVSFIPCSECYLIVLVYIVRHFEFLVN